ncbi:MAG: aspartate aminotransferase family protein, partial [Chloroflexi bacterium]|nr:aspartate aminotransferase family protein [Chloroflexota bacterium]
MIAKQLQREIDRYVAKTPKSRQLQEQASLYMPGGSSRSTQYFDPYPIFVDRGEGHYVYDVDSNRYLDFSINITSLIMGHAHPAIVQALQTQAAKGTAFSAPTEAQIRLAKILCDRVPSVETLRFTNSGTEATLMAIRAARAFTGKHKIAKFEGAYHGSHEYASVSVRPSIAKLDPKGPTPLLEYPGQPPSIAEDVVVLPYNNLHESERILKEHKNDLACVIMEPIASSFGHTPGKLEFLKGMRDVTRDLGILLIFDEVQSFSVAPGGAQELFDIVPDLTTLGKIIGGGMAVGAFGGREDIMALFNQTESGAVLTHAGTYNANPMTMLAGEVTMNHLTPQVYKRLSNLGHILRARLRAVFDDLSIAAQVTGIASLLGIHFTSEEIT